MFEKFKDAVAWKHSHAAGMHDYYENSRNGDRKVVLKLERVLNGILISGYSPYDPNWLSEAKGKAIIVWGLGDKEIIEHEDLHKLKQNLTLPTGGSCITTPEPVQ